MKNCEHSSDGWCLPCVKRLFLEKEQLRDAMAVIHGSLHAADEKSADAPASADAHTEEARTISRLLASPMKSDDSYTKDQAAVRRATNKHLFDSNQERDKAMLAQLQELIDSHLRCD